MQKKRIFLLSSWLFSPLFRYFVVIQKPKSTETESLIQKPKFRLLNQTFGFVSAQPLSSSASTSPRPEPTWLFGNEPICNFILSTAVGETWAFVLYFGQLYASQDIDTTVDIPLTVHCAAMFAHWTLHWERTAVDTQTLRAQPNIPPPPLNMNCRIWDLAMGPTHIGQIRHAVGIFTREKCAPGSSHRLITNKLGDFAGADKVNILMSDSFQIDLLWWFAQVRCVPEHPTD